MKQTIIDENKKIASITLSGELNGSNLPTLTKKIHELIDQNINHLILDLSEIHFVSSLGIGCIVESGQKFVDKKGSLSLVCNTPRLLEEFELMHLKEIVSIHLSLDDALASLT